MNNYDLSNKHILFVGGETGLDRVILQQLKNSMGIMGDNCDPTTSRLTIYNQLDISIIETDIKSIVKDNGPFDGVVFNVVHSDFRPLQFVNPELMNQIINDNYSIFVEIVRALKKCRGLNCGASIVAMSSISSFRAMKAKMAFCASKAALDAAVRCLAVELAPNGIRINSIQKGAVDVDAEKAHIQNILAVRDEETSNGNHIPLGKVKAEEVAETVAFLLSDAVKTMTGTSVVIDGGYTA